MYQIHRSFRYSVGTLPKKDEPFSIHLLVLFLTSFYVFATFFYSKANGQGVVYSPKKEELSSPTYMYRRGAGQLFSQPEHTFQVGSLH